MSEPQAEQPQQQKKQQAPKQPKEKKAADGKKAFNPASFPVPDYSAKRIEVWERARAKRAEEAKGMYPNSNFRPLSAAREKIFCRAGRSFFFHVPSTQLLRLPSRLLFPMDPSRKVLHSRPLLLMSR